MSDSYLRNKSSDPKQGVYFIGTTPPKQDTDIELVSGIADKLLDRLADLEPYALTPVRVSGFGKKAPRPRARSRR